MGVGFMYTRMATRVQETKLLLTCKTYRNLSTI